ncbi:MAG: hypothetical protein QXW62_04420 [Candidatus Methanomethylicaceae archaeon]|nr:hypothetical protein [Candidatus Verstraetearchaeota archaeon]
MRKICFSFLKEKNGKLFPLPDVAEDVISLMKAFNILDNKFKTIIGFLNDDSIEKIELFYKIYYPVYIVKMENMILCIDALDLQKTKIINFLDSNGHNQKIYEFALLRVKDLLDWECATFEGEIDDGFAIPYLLKKEDAILIAKEVIIIYKSLKEKIENLKKEKIKEEEEFQKNIQAIEEERKKIEKEFEEEICEKRKKVEKLLSTYEKEAIKKIHENYRKQKQLLESKKREFKELLDCLQKELIKTDEEILELKRSLNDIKRKLFDLNKKREEIITKEKSENKFNEIKKVLEVLEKSNVSINELRALEEEKLRKLDNLEKMQDRVKSKIEEIKEIISRLINNINDIPIREELECRKAKEEFLKNRINLINELNLLLEERNKKLYEYYIKEEILKFEFNLIKNKINESLQLLEDNKKKLEKYILITNNEIEDNIELLYVPFYLIFKENDVKIIEPIIILKNRGKSEHIKLGLDSEIVKFALIKHLPLLIFEAKDVFNILNKRNKDRILQGISILKNKKAINKLQEDILLRRIEV